VLEDFDSCYRAVCSRDERFDGWFFTAVTSTRIYCRPSCPARTPKPQNVRFYPTAAAAQQAGFRACLRCRPDASPGSPEWRGRANVAARAMRLILDGTVDREGVAGVARRVGYSERQLHRVLLAELGTGALSLARAQRAQTARVLLASTELAVSEVAFAAGFDSVRQFNDTVRDVFARTPSELRRRARAAQQPGSLLIGARQAISLRLTHRQPLASSSLLEFLGRRAIEGVEAYDGATYRRTLRLPHGAGTVALSAGERAGEICAVFILDELRDLTAAVARCRHLLNLDADPVAIDQHLADDPLLGALVRRTPGLRVPGTVEGFELAARAVIGQQVSLAAARTVAASLVRAAGTSIADPVLPTRKLFPSAQALARLARDRPSAFAMPASRRMTLAALSEAVAAGELAIDQGADPVELERGLLAIRGVGAWTASYIAMRALGDPDAFLATDLGVRHAVAALGGDSSRRAIAAAAERWRPWRAHAVMHLWSTLAHAAGASEATRAIDSAAGARRGPAPRVQSSRTQAMRATCT
jgi:AraC family transcriptional regulator, regulatory protein of adaptative response / DNA-3-methyladenine glycosylase II